MTFSERLKAQKCRGYVFSVTELRYNEISDLNDLYWPQSTRRISTTYNETYVRVLMADDVRFHNANG